MSDKTSDKASDKASDKSSDKASDKSSDKKADKKNDKTVTVSVPAKGTRPAADASKAVNAGPQRGNNSFPASNKRRVVDTSRSARDSTAEREGPGGKYGTKE